MLRLVFDSVSLSVHMRKLSSSHSHGNEFLAFMFINESSGSAVLLINTNNAEKEAYVCPRRQSQVLVFIFPFKKKALFSPDWPILSRPPVPLCPFMRFV